jgi:hypothetical protein
LVDDDPFSSWFEALERRHLSTLTFAEVRRSVQALSAIYVEHRNRLNSGSALSGAGKRAAFALFFAPLHFLLVREIARALKAAIPAGTTVIDLGCGTGPAGAAWVMEAGNGPSILGVDTNSWALEECRWNYRLLRIRGAVQKSRLDTFRMPSKSAVIAAFTMNEMPSEVRTRLLDELLKVHRSGLPVLVVEPIAKKLISWWSDWESRFTAAGGQSDEWRFRVELPERLALMDRAAGLDHRELTGRSLWLPGK